MLSMTSQWAVTASPDRRPEGAAALHPSPIGRGVGGEGTGTRRRYRLRARVQIALALRTTTRVITGESHHRRQITAPRFAPTLTPTRLPRGEGLARGQSAAPGTWAQA
jgi:hypothetical protein